MKKSKNLILYSAIIINVILILLLIFNIYQFQNLKPLESIKGFYQSIEHLPDLYEFNFNQEKEFFIKTNDKIIEEGMYGKYKDNIYVCYGNNETFIISLLNKGFYIYDDSNERVIEFKKVSNTPSS